MNIKEKYKQLYNISEEVYDLADDAINTLESTFKQIDEVAEYNQIKVLAAMQKNRLSDTHFGYSTGYGYNDAGREVLEDIYKDVFNAEAALVRPQIISGTHALTTALFGNLKYGDELVSISGIPYDTLVGVIGIRETKGSLIEHGVTYKQCDLKENGEFDFDSIKQTVSSKTTMVCIQRSKGYSWRNSLTIEKIKEAIKFVKNINENIIVMVDNCYGEFVEKLEPTDVGADMCVGSLIKNPGGGLAPVGGYIVGKEEIIENCAYRLTAPGLGREVGPSLGMVQPLIHGLFLAPTVTASSLKGAVFASCMFEKLGYEVSPKSNDIRTDIVQAVKFKDKEKLIKFCQGIQKGSPVDSFVVPEPWDMPGYDNQVIMAAGAFIQGSSIELSADAPIKEPYIAYFQGGLTWQHAKIGIMIGVQNVVGDSLK